MAKGTILVVDDDPAMQWLVGQILDEEGYRVVQAMGVEAAARARVAHPDLILLDVMMPIVDGTTVSRQVRADAATAHIPIVAMTAQRPQTAPAGLLADDWLCKPCEVAEFAARWRSGCPRQRDGRHAWRPQKALPGPSPRQRNGDGPHHTHGYRAWQDGLRRSPRAAVLAAYRIHDTMVSRYY